MRNGAANYTSAIPPTYKAVTYCILLVIMIHFYYPQTQALKSRECKRRLPCPKKESCHSIRFQVISKLGYNTVLGETYHTLCICEKPPRWNGGMWQAWVSAVFSLVVAGALSRCFLSKYLLTTQRYPSLCRATSLSSMDPRHLLLLQI